MESKKNESIKGHLSDQETALYLDFLLFEDRSNLSENVLTHVENCSSCKDTILDVFLSLQNSQLPKNMTPFQERIYPKTIKKISQKSSAFVKQIAASFFILALLLSFYFSVIKKNLYQEKANIREEATSITNRIRQEEQKKSPSTSAQPETSAINQDDKKTTLGKKISQNTQNPDFRINSNLELMINSQSRNETIKVISPENKSSLGGEILFTWEPFTIKPIQLKILNNKNETLFEFTVTKNNFIFTEILSPGLYYWKLESQNDLLYVGKFFIEKQTNSPKE